MAFDKFSETALGRQASSSSPAEDLSGFRLLPLPAFSLDARIALAQRAERSLDVQYYLIRNDDTGRLFLRSLRDAAERGVRVRVLVDDLYTADSDDLLRALAAYPGVEVRLFNPFAAARGSIFSRFAASLFDLERVNHRMHNKLFVADNSMGIIGGRNIADSYFQHDGSANFVDMDVLAVGPVVHHLSAFFDDFWNSKQAFPIDSLVPADAPLPVLRQRFEALTSENAAPTRELAAEDPLGFTPLSQDFKGPQDALRLTWARAEAFSDKPTKVLSRSIAGEPLTSEAHDTVLFNVRVLVRSAKKEVLETMPYLIPGHEGMESIRRLRERDVKFSVLTNSLAASDEPIVHSGYRRYRSELLRLGVDLFELSPRMTANVSRFGTLGASSARLHGKLAVVDRKAVFVGSMNFDPRSDSQNTEVGLIIFSPFIAQQVYGLITDLQREAAYHVRLNALDQSLEWWGPEGQPSPTPTIFRTEPESDFWTRWKLYFLAPFVPESML